MRVDPQSDLAGYSFETSKGRFATFFWQNYYDPDVDMDAYDFYVEPDGGGIYSSTFLKTSTSWELSRYGGRFNTLVAANAKKGTPLAAISWSNGLKAAVYYLDKRNNLCERQTTDGGHTWLSGSLTNLAVPARNNSSLAAAVSWEELDAFEIHLYFQDGSNKIRHLQFLNKENCWSETTPSCADDLKGVSGTSIAATVDTSDVSTYTWYLYRQSTERFVQEFSYAKDDDEWDNLRILNQCFDRNVRLGCLAGPWSVRVFAHDGAQAIERTYTRKPASKRLAETVLPTSTGTGRILQNFIVLYWSADPDLIESEIHLFSMDHSEGILCDYLVGPATGVEVRLFYTEP